MKDHGENEKEGLQMRQSKVHLFKKRGYSQKEEKMKKKRRNRRMKTKNHRQNKNWTIQKKNKEIGEKKKYRDVNERKNGELEKRQKKMIWMLLRNIKGTERMKKKTMSRGNWKNNVWM